jgi:hypothetical protein
MKKILFSLTISLPVMLLIAACGNANTKDKKPETEKKNPDKPAVSFMLDGRLIESSEYYCSWQLTDKENMLTFNVIYDREPKRNPPNLGFVIYNLKDITLPFIRMNGKLPGKTEQFFSLSASLGLLKGKAADMNEISFSDNYSGLQSNVKLNLLDTTIRLVSGSFEGTIKNAAGKTLKVSEGKFEGISLKMVYSSKPY